VALRRFTQPVIFPVGHDADHFQRGRIRPEREAPPIGDCPGQNVAAKVWLTTATRGAPTRSCSEKSRPSMSGVPIVRK